MHLSSTTAVRLLAAWHQQRRELSDRLEGLLLHGPTAVDRVAGRADELRLALDAERDAFEAFVAVVQGPGRGTAPHIEAASGRGEPPRVYPPLRAVNEAGL